ncbi:MAG: hypothetical protein JW808_08725 [Victivallales bacterium]|nr:hypothetical protein [Victivallales bacterium]
MSKSFVVFLLLVLLSLLLSSCFATTERERRGVSHIPFNTPDQGRGRTFDGDF